MSATIGAVPFSEAIDFLRGKLRLTSRGYTEVWQEQNALAFTVAGAQSAQMVGDFHDVITKAIRDGTTLAEFREDFDAIVEQYGWSYRGKRGWRSRVIFETNLRNAYAAGRWQQAWEAREERPFLRYVMSSSEVKRPLHLKWVGTILPITHPWWRTHYPPNGWGCDCKVQSLSARDMERRGFTVTDPAPKPNPIERTINTPDGPRVEMVPEGIDPGWAYNVGLAGQSARAAQQAARALGTMPADLGAVVGEAMATATRRALAEDFRVWVAERAAANWRPDGSWCALGALSPGTIDALGAMDRAPASAGVVITAQQLAHLTRQTKRDEGVALGLADVLRLPAILDAPEAVLIERATGVVLLVFTPTDDPRRGKLVVELGIRRQVRMQDGTRQKAVYNAVKTATLIDPNALADQARYEIVEGSL